MENRSVDVEACEPSRTPTERQRVNLVDRDAKVDMTNKEMVDLMVECYLDGYDTATAALIGARTRLAAETRKRIESRFE